MLILTVYAGFGGQKFIPEMLPKIKTVYDTARSLGLSPDIQVDGGINAETAYDVASHGANVLVAGSYLFGTSDYTARTKAIKEGARRGETLLSS